MTWMFLTKPLELVHDMLICGGGPNVSVTTYEEKNSRCLRFRDCTVGFELIRQYSPLFPMLEEKIDLCCISHLRTCGIYGTLQLPCGWPSECVGANSERSTSDVAE